MAATWVDDVVKVAGQTCIWLAQDRDRRHSKERDACTQQRDKKTVEDDGEAWILLFLKHSVR